MSVSPTDIRVAVGTSGGFDTEMLLGADGKTPIVVENQGDVNIARLEKGRTRSLKYSDASGNKIDAKDSNSDRGRFERTDKTTSFF